MPYTTNPELQFNDIKSSADRRAEDVLKPAFFNVMEATKSAEIDAISVSPVVEATQHMGQAALSQETPVYGEAEIINVETQLGADYMAQLARENVQRALQESQPIPEEFRNAA